MYPSDSPTIMTTTSIAIDSSLELDTNCTDLGNDTTGIVVDSISAVVEPTLGENQILESVFVTSICGNTLIRKRKLAVTGRRKIQASTAPIRYTLQVAELCGNDCDTNPEVAAALANTVQSTLISSFSDGSFEAALHEKCMEYNNTMLTSASVSPVTLDDFVYTLVTRSPTKTPVENPGSFFPTLAAKSSKPTYKEAKSSKRL